VLTRLGVMNWRCQAGDTSSATHLIMSRVMLSGV